MSFGSGEFTYELARGWGRLPPGWELGEAASVAVDSQDRVYVLTRSPHPVMVFDREGNYLASWGEGEFTQRAHGIYVGPDDSVYCVDDGNHTARKFARDGKLLLMLGTKEQPSDTGYTVHYGDLRDSMSIKRGGPPFNRPTDAAVSASGEIYVSDGYGNARVHKFTPEGRLLLSWGKPGNGPGQFQLPHGVWVDKQGWVYVADRENNRIQVFTAQGEFLSQWTDFLRPTDIVMDKGGNIYISELNQRVSILNPQGKLLARWGGEDLFIAPHGIWADSHGDLYIAEVLSGRRVLKFVRKT